MLQGATNIFTVYLMNHIFETSVLLIRDNIMYRTWLFKHLKKVRSIQAAIFVLNWVKRSFSLWILSRSFLFFSFSWRTPKSGNSQGNPKSIRGKTYGNSGMVHFAEINQVPPPYSMLQDIGRIATPKLDSRNCLRYLQTTFIMGGGRLVSEFMWGIV